jgi:hypothetical protein
MRKDDQQLPAERTRIRSMPIPGVRFGGGECGPTLKRLKSLQGLADRETGPAVNDQDETTSPMRVVKKIGE